MLGCRGGHSDEKFPKVMGLYFPTRLYSETQLRRATILILILILLIHCVLPVLRSYPLAFVFFLLLFFFFFSSSFFLQFSSVFFSFLFFFFCSSSFADSFHLCLPLVSPWCSACVKFDLEVYHHKGNFRKTDPGDPDYYLCVW